MLQYYTYALKTVASCGIIICGDGFVMQSNMHLSETTPKLLEFISLTLRFFLKWLGDQCSSSLKF